MFVLGRECAPSSDRMGATLRNPTTTKIVSVWIFALMETNQIGELSAIGYERCTIVHAQEIVSRRNVRSARNFCPGQIVENFRFTNSREKC